MFKRELKCNLKSSIIWTSIIILIYLLVYLVYPSIINSGNISEIDEMMKLFPEEILKAFNMDISSLDSAYGWLKSEGFIFILLLTGSYASILGSTIVLKEENDKTIEYLNTLPITRNNILNGKVLAGLVHVISMILIFTIFNFISLKLSGDLDIKEFLLLSITPIFSSFVLFFISLFVSMHTHKSKKMLGFSLAIVFISYILTTVASLDESVEFLKYASVFTLCDVRNVMINKTIKLSNIVVCFVLSIILYLLSKNKYNKKELL